MHCRVVCGTVDVIGPGRGSLLSWWLSRGSLIPRLWGCATRVESQASGCSGSAPTIQNIHIRLLLDSRP